MSSAPQLPAASAKLLAAQQRTGSLLSLGLEPCPEYLPAGFRADIEGYYEFLRQLIGATKGLCAAYKFNLAFFEALGPDGWRLLFRVRELLPADTLIIADAKRGDIGSSAKRYADALYRELAADSATVNPLMGRDAVEPFFAYGDRLTFCLVLTSNPGAADFLLPGDLYRTIAAKLGEWAPAGQAGFVVGATRAGQVADLRARAPHTPFLVPGIGAQGGDLQRVIAEGRTGHGIPGLLLHVTRGILPQGTGEPFEEGVRRLTLEWNNRVASALA